MRDDAELQSEEDGLENQMDLLLEKCYAEQSYHQLVVEAMDTKMTELEDQLEALKLEEDKVKEVM